VVAASLGQAAQVGQRDDDAAPVPQPPLYLQRPLVEVGCTVVIAEVLRELAQVVERQVDADLVVQLASQAKALFE